MKDDIRGSPKTTKAALFYLIALLHYKKITMITAGTTFGVTNKSISIKLRQVIDVMKKTKIMDL